LKAVFTTSSTFIELLTIEVMVICPVFQLTTLLLPRQQQHSHPATTTDKPYAINVTVAATIAFAFKGRRSREGAGEVPAPRRTCKREILGDRRRRPPMSEIPPANRHGAMAAGVFDDEVYPTVDARWNTTFHPNATHASSGSSASSLCYLR
jgi:hypothetical protein